MPTRPIVRFFPFRSSRVAAAGVTFTGNVSLPRLTPKARVLPALFWITDTNWLQVSTGMSSTETMTSPGSSLAFSAAEPFAITPATMPGDFRATSHSFSVPSLSPVRTNLPSGVNTAASTRFPVAISLTVLPLSISQSASGMSPLCENTYFPPGLTATPRLPVLMPSKVPSRLPVVRSHSRPPETTRFPSGLTAVLDTVLA